MPPSPETAAVKGSVASRPQTHPVLVRQHMGPANPCSGGVERTLRPACPASREVEASEPHRGRVDDVGGCLRVGAPCGLGGGLVVVTTTTHTVIVLSLIHI